MTSALSIFDPSEGGPAAYPGGWRTPALHAMAKSKSMSHGQPAGKIAPESLVYTDNVALQERTGLDAHLWAGVSLWCVCATTASPAARSVPSDVQSLVQLGTAQRLPGRIETHHAPSLISPPARCSPAASERIRPDAAYTPSQAAERLYAGAPPL
jgi:hypothetical protein